MKGPTKMWEGDDLLRETRYGKNKVLEVQCRRWLRRGNQGKKRNSDKNKNKGMGWGKRHGGGRDNIQLRDAEAANGYRKRRRKFNQREKVDPKSYGTVECALRVSSSTLTFPNLSPTFFNSHFQKFNHTENENYVTCTLPA